MLKIGDKSGETKCYGSLGNAYGGLGNSQEAINYYNKSLSISQKIGDKEEEYRAYYNLANLYYVQKLYEKSLDYTKNALKLVNLIKESLIQERISLAFLRHRFDIYNIGIDSALNLYKKTNNTDCLKDALEIIERTKSRELVKKLGVKRKKDPKLKHEYEELEKIELKINELEAMLRKLLKDKISVSEVNTKLESLYKQKTKLLNEIWLKSVDPHSLTPSVDLNLLNSFWESFGNYNDNCTILEMYEQGDRIIYILLDKENIRFFEKKIDKQDLQKDIEGYLKMLDNPLIPVDTFYTVLNHIVYDILPQKLMSELKNIETKDLFIIPHRWLNQITWEAVVMDDAPLSIKYNLIRNYSLDLIRLSLSYPKVDNKSALIVANPTLDLEGAKDECIEVEDKIKGYGINPLYENDAKLEPVKDSLAKVSLAHFACHAKFNIEDPFASQILLNDRSLLASDISMMDFNFYPFIFLNACETGSSEVKNIDIESVIKSVGDEQMGFVRAFTMAHTPSMIVTSWEIEDKVAKEFAGYFYKELSENNIINALKIAREKTYEDFKDESKDWAAYVLYGNPFNKL